jgi:dipeptidyl aminopeptidase/acylaminoacyl peptidase
MRNIAIAAAICTALTSVAVSAQAALDASQAAIAFGSRERVGDASLSPDGSKVAFVSPGPKQATVVQVLDMKTGSAKAVNYANGDPMTLTSCGWASNNRLVCTLYGVSNVQGGWESYSRLIGIDADGNNPTPLGIMQRGQDYISHSDGYVVDWLDGNSDKVLVARNYVPLKSNAITVGSKAQGLAVDLLDTRTGAATLVESADPLVGQYIADGRGTARIKRRYDALRFGASDNGIMNFYYRPADSRDWKPFSTYSTVAETGLYPLAVDGTANVAYVLEKLDGRDALYRIALDGSMKKELAFSHPQVDVGGVITVGRRGRVVGATFSTERREAHYFDPAYETLVTSLSRALPNLPLIRIIDSSADEKTHLVYAASDTDPGRYFLYDSVRKSLNPLGADRPELAGVALGKVQSITYQSTDGTAIPAYLTLPPGGTKDLPAIVMPHGGPASRDDWGFDWLAQFFVNRGYAVIQPNYRGSSGYGQGWFQKNGFKSWKTAIGDVNDAGRWLVKQGIANPKKLAIVGWSYGGYAALQSNVLDPDLFKAAIAIAPVTDLGALRSEIPAYSRAARDFIGEGPHLAEGSPARHAAQFRIPVLMFHGAKDLNVSVAESKAMDRQLRAAGKASELVIYPAIDHQLRDSAVRADLLAKADAFLKTALN